MRSVPHAARKASLRLSCDKPSGERDETHREYGPGLDATQLPRGALDVIRHGPQEERVPGFVEEFVSELLSGVGEQRRYEGTLGGTQPNPPVVLDILDLKAAVLELTAASTGTRIVTTDGRHRCPVSPVVRGRVREVGSRSIFRNVQFYRALSSCVSWCTRWCDSPRRRAASRALIFSLPVRNTRTARRAARAARRSSSSAFLRSVA